MHPDLERVLFSTEQIHQRIEELAAQIGRDYASRPGLVLAAVLKGSVFFLTDLCRALSLPLRLDFLAISSFTGSAAGGRIRIEKDLDLDIGGQHVLLIEDIVDTGFTLRYLLETLGARRPASLEVCTLLDKTSRRLLPVPVKYRCFEIPDRFVVGYGLDYQQLYRNLPCLGILRGELFRPERAGAENLTNVPTGR